MSIFAQQGGLGVAKNQTGIRKNNVFVNDDAKQGGATEPFGYAGRRY